MKVAMLGWEFPPFMAGGLGIHCLELTRGLAAAGVVVDFYMPRMAAAQEPLGAGDQRRHLRIVEVEAAPVVGPYAGGEAGGYAANFDAAVAIYNERLVASFDSLDADLIHCHDWITVPAALELRRRTGLPVVLTVHSTEYDRSGGFMPQAWLEEIERVGVNAADRVIAVSRYTKTLIEDRYGVDPERVIPIYNGVNLAGFHSSAGRQYETCRGSVLFLSRLCRQKGPRFFIEAARRVLEVRPETRFVIAGTGHMEDELKAYARENGIADSVTFLGFVPDDQLASVYAQNEVYVLPSVSEPFGISVLEALATGLPTIVSKTCGVAEALAHVLKVDHWDTDEIADMILRLLDSPALREVLGRNGAHEVHRFTWAECAQRTIGVYAGLIKSREKGRTPPQRVVYP